MKSNSRAIVTSPTSTGRGTDAASMLHCSLDVLNHNAMDLVNHVFQTVHHSFEVVENLRGNPEIQSMSRPHAVEKAASGGIMQVIRDSLDSCDLFREAA